MNEEARSFLLLMAACTSGRETELTGLAQTIFETSALFKISAGLEKYFFLTCRAQELKQQIAKFRFDAASFEKALNSWHEAAELFAQFSEMQAQEFMPQAIYHIIHRDDYPSLLEQAKDNLGEKLYDAVRFWDVRSLKKVAAPDLNNINEVVAYTKQLDTYCSPQLERNITNLTRENIFAFFYYNTVTELTVRMFPAEFIEWHYPEQSMEELFADTVFYAVSRDNYYNVLQQFRQLKKAAGLDEHSGKSGWLRRILFIVLWAVFMFILLRSYSGSVFRDILFFL